MDNEKMTFGQLIEKYRRGKQLNQEELAFRSGISSEALSLIERDISKQILISTFIKIAINVDLSPWKLLKIAEEKGILIDLLGESKYGEQVKEYLETYSVNKDE
ncbi:helix-turn-helix domain-containing protein [Pseudoneobacillus sp. C159]